MNETTAAPAAVETAVTAEPAVAEQNTTEGVAQTSEPTAKPEKTAEQKELEYLRRKATKADRNNARLYQELQEARRIPAANQSAGKVEVDPQELESVIETRAKEKQRISDLNKRCDSIAEKGRKDFPDFERALDAVKKEIPLFNESGATPALEAIMEMDNPSALLHYLGMNPDVAFELADLSPIKLTRRLDQIERDMKPQRQTSLAPKPLEPVKPTASPSEPDPEKDPTAWIAMRNKQEREQRKR